MSASITALMGEMECLGADDIKERMHSLRIAQEARPNKQLNREEEARWLLWEYFLNSILYIELARKRSLTQEEEVKLKSAKQEMADTMCQLLSKGWLPPSKAVEKLSGTVTNEKDLSEIYGRVMECLPENDEKNNRAYRRFAYEMAALDYTSEPNPEKCEQWLQALGNLMLYDGWSNDEVLEKVRKRFPVMPGREHSAWIEAGEVLERLAEKMARKVERQKELLPKLMSQRLGEYGDLRNAVRAQNLGYVLGQMMGQNLTSEVLAERMLNQNVIAQDTTHAYVGMMRGLRKSAMEHLARMGNPKLTEPAAEDRAIENTHYASVLLQWADHYGQKAQNCREQGGPCEY